jgi:hypothetical protein
MSKYLRSDEGRGGTAFPVQMAAVGDCVARDGTPRLMFELACGCDRPDCHREMLSPMVLSRIHAAEVITMLRTAAEDIWPGFVADLDQEATALNHSQEA